jgi:hypothetical protein
MLPNRRLIPNRLVMKDGVRRMRAASGRGGSRSSLGRHRPNWRGCKPRRRGRGEARRRNLRNSSLTLDQHPVIDPLDVIRQSDVRTCGGLNLRRGRVYLDLPLDGQIIGRRAKFRRSNMAAESVRHQNRQAERESDAKTLGSHVHPIAGKVAGFSGRDLVRTQGRKNTGCRVYFG